MITGTIYNTGKIMEMTRQWEQKLDSGNLLQKNIKELSPEERELQNYKEQLARERESNEYSMIYAKIQSGQELTPAEEDKLRARDPKLYMEYKADRMEAEAYEKKLRNCRTKEEAQRLHVNRMNGKLTELKSIVNNPNIPKSEKFKQAQRILGDTTRTMEVFHSFAQSGEYKELPTEEEIMKARQEQTEAKQQEMLPDEAKQALHPDEKDLKSDMQEVKPDMHDKKTNLQNAEGGEQSGVSRVLKEVSGEEKDILDEMLRLGEEHFGERQKSLRIDVSL